MSIPKRPLAVSKAKKTLPLTIDWGEGIPKDRLRYINAREEGLIKAARSTTAVRSHAGVTAYADDSASSKGVSRGSGTTTGTTTTKSSTGGGASSGAGGAYTGQGGQSKGPSGAGQGPNSPSSSSSSSASSATGGGSKSSSSSTPASSPSSASNKAPSAASQASSGRYGSKAPTNASAASVSPSKAPNAAAAAASDRLKASEAAKRASAAAKASSVQTMINNQSRPPTQSAAGAEKLVQDKWFNNQLGSLYNDPAINRDLPNALKEGMWNQRISDATKLARDPTYTGSFGERTLAPDPGSGFRTKEQAAANAANGTGIARSFHNYGLAADVWTNGAPSYLSKGYKTWENDFARANQDLATHIPDSYGIKWGGDFGDPAHFQVGSGSRSKAIDTYGSNVTREGVRPDGVTGSTASYGPPSLGGNVGLAAAVTPLQKALDSWNPPKATGIPTPNGQTVASTVPQQQQQAQAPMPNARPPSQNMQTPPGWAQQAQGNPPTMSPNNPFGALGPVGAARQQSLAARIGVDDALSANPTTPIPTARPPTQNMQAGLPGFSPSGLPGNFRGTAGQAYSPGGPSTYSPQVAAGDAVSEDAPVYSDNPVQGSQNPMQDEGENPQVKRDRQMKYASRGATLGGLIAGPVGTAVGATLGWQMGKTSPQQRMAIASNPQALQANVQSINEMVEDRGGKGNPNLTVTEAGLKDVLENPQKVTSNPQAYTSLESQLASLAQGIDPATGKPV